MTISEIRDFLMWCSVINVALMILLFLILWLGRSWVYKMHSKMFPITEQQFNVIIYSFLGVYKLLVYMFNIIPYIAVSIVMA
ncbi:MAG: hypothetical protein H8E62_02895 [Planctomycetes bacterium]|nr:hypothetical protein [Planctomycetota bacterium]